MWSKLPRMTEIRSMGLFLRLVDSLETIILMVMMEHIKVTPTTQAFLKPLSAHSVSISLVKLSHMPQTNINGKATRAWYSSERNTAKDLEGGRTTWKW